jgi:hypothetical protein
VDEAMAVYNEYLKTQPATEGDADKGQDEKS